ncbi:MAG: GGDEF domain-containing protein, partial [Gallionellaceae bacterium]|nr:GGDEF domain-containing protein [Gallionellaceae bacterium]
MSNSNTPSDIARETLKALAARKLAPTPENYAHMYHEIGGEPAPAAAGGKTTIVPVWSELIRDLLRQLETPHKGITITRKKEGVETVLSRFSKDPEVLFEKLRGLMRSWSGAPTAPPPDELVPAPVPAQPSARTAAPLTTSGESSAQPDNLEMLNQLRELLAQTLE